MSVVLLIIGVGIGNSVPAPLARLRFLRPSRNVCYPPCQPHGWCVQASSDWRGVFPPLHGPTSLWYLLQGQSSLHLGANQCAPLSAVGAKTKRDLRTVGQYNEK